MLSSPIKLAPRRDRSRTIFSARDRGVAPNAQSGQRPLLFYFGRSQPRSAISDQRGEFSSALPSIIRVRAMAARRTSNMTAVDQPNRRTPFIAVIGPSNRQGSMGVTSLGLAVLCLSRQFCSLGLLLFQIPQTHSRCQPEDDYAQGRRCQMNAIVGRSLSRPDLQCARKRVSRDARPKKRGAIFAALTSIPRTIGSFGAQTDTCGGPVKRFRIKMIQSDDAFPSASVLPSARGESPIAECNVSSSG